MDKIPDQGEGVQRGRDRQQPPVPPTARTQQPFAQPYTPPAHPAYLAYPPQPPHLPPIAKREKKKDLIIVATILIAGIAALAALAYTFSTSLPETWVVLKDGEVDMANNTRYAMEIYGDRIRIDLSVEDNKTVDLLIMTRSDYYSYLGNTTSTFSAEKKYLNITDLHKEIPLPYSAAVDLYLVIDNTDIPLLPDDAPPQDNLRLQIHVETNWDVWD